MVYCFFLWYYVTWRVQCSKRLVSKQASRYVKHRIWTRSQYQQRVRRTDRYMHKNVALKPVIYVVVRRPHDVVVRRRHDVVRWRRDDDVRVLLSKQVDTWNIVYELVHRITTACRKDRQIFTQECNTTRSSADADKPARRLVVLGSKWNHEK